MIRTIREFTHEELLAAKYIKAKRKSIQKILFSFIYYKQIDETVRLVHNQEVFGHVLFLHRAYSLYRHRLRHDGEDG